MKEEEVFNINGRGLYLDEVIWDLNGIPVFIVCIDNVGDYYMVLCSDLYLQRYFIVNTSKEKLRDFVNKKTSVKSMFTQESSYFEVYADVDGIVNKDVVHERDIENLSKLDLPEDNLFFETTTREQKNQRKVWE